MKTTTLIVLAGWALATGAAVATSSHLAESPLNALWHAPAAAEEAVFVGDAKNTEPVLVLAKDPIAQAPLAIKIYSDAQKCRIDAAGVTLEFALESDQPNTLVLDGTELRPTIKLNGRELMPVRGQWIQMVLRQSEPTLQLRLVGGTYATLRFGPAIPLVPASAGTPGASAEPAPGRTPAGVPPPLLPTQVVPAGSPHGEIPGDQRELLAPTRPWDLSLRTGMDVLTTWSYRGIVRQDKNSILEPWADLDMRAYGNAAPRGCLLNAVDLVWGFRSIHLGGGTPVKMGQNETWFEFDWYGGISATLLDRWTLGVLYENLESIRTSFRDVHQFTIRLAFDDRDPRYSWSIQPYILVTREFEKQSDAGWLTPANAVDPRFHRGTYGEVGIRPTFPLFRLYLPERLTLAVPMAAGFSLGNYYEDRLGHDNTFGYAQGGPILDVPIASFAGPGSHRFVWKLRLAAQVLYAGHSARDISEGLGVANHPWRVIGSGGLMLEF